MIQFFIYLIEASICLSLLYLVYLIFIHDTFYRIKRFYLIFSIIISLLIPQLYTPEMIDNIGDNIISTGITNSGDITNYSDSFEKIVFGNIPAEFNINRDYKNERNNNVLIVSFIFYLLGVGYFLYKFISNLNQLFKIITDSDRKKYDGSTLVYHKLNLSNFSFFNYIFLNTDTGNENHTVLMHEQLHAKCLHSLDIIFLEICRIVFWFNPVVWFYKKSLLKVHEYQVDDLIIRDDIETAATYQELLLKQYLSNINIELAHPFNYSLVKFRIKMMKKSKSKWWAKFKVIFALPIIIISLLAFSNVKNNISNETDSNLKQETFKETQPYGMVFVPMGSFTLKRSDGINTKEFNVSVDAFWMKETEVRVKEYLDYLESVKKDSSNIVYTAALPDKTKAPFEGYFESKEFYNYPLVGISLKQAENYCKWLTRVENLKLKSEGKPPVADYRIPTEVEWTYASFGGSSPDEIKISDKPGLYEIKKSNLKSSDFNEFGLLGMFNNASEWTFSYFDSEKYMKELQNNPLLYNQIIVKGGIPSKTKAAEKEVMDGSQAFYNVGFRYVRTYLGKQYGKN